MPILDFAPIDAEGIRRDKPSSTTKWVKLTNVSFQDGAIVPRPGFKEFADMNDLDRPSTVEVSSILALAQIENPGSTATGRESWTLSTESIVPTGSSDLVAGWTGDHTAVDETPFSTADNMSTSTEGAQKSLTFGNPAITFDTIQGVQIVGLATNTESGGSTQLAIYQRVGSTNYEIGTVDIYTSLDVETAYYQPFSLWLPLSLDDDQCLAQADLDALNIVVEYVSGTRSVLEWTKPSGDGTDTDWIRGGTTVTAGAYTDFDNDSFVYNATLPEDAGVYTDTNGDKQGFTISSFNTGFATISSFNLNMWFWQATTGENSIQVIFKNSGGTEYPMTADGDTSSTVTFGFGPSHMSQITKVYSLNPEDSAAWAQADITGGEFIIKNVSPVTYGTAGTRAFFLRSVTPIVEGLVTGQTVTLAGIRAQIFGTTGSLPGSGLRTTRLWATNLDEVRADDDTGSAPTFTDVTNSVSLATSPPGIPVDHAILYGQVYMVNGVDNTIRYPNASNLFEGLSTNNADGATALTGRTIASFANRIIYGWVKDNTTVTPERVSYSKIFDGGTHVDAAGSAGDFDLLDTPGGVVNLTQLNEDICFAGKEQGIYALRASGNSLAPLFRDVVDFSTRCLSITGVQRIINVDGSPMVLFLGWNPTAGYNIFAFDGSRVVAVGDPIARHLREDANHQMLRFAFTGIEPLTGAYWIAFAEGTNINVNSGYAFHLRTGAWTRFELGFDITSFGNWTIPDVTNLTAACKVLWGEPRLIAGALVPMVSSRAFIADSAAPPAHDAANANINRFSGNTDGRAGRKLAHITSTLETGDIDLTNPEGAANTMGYRWEMEYEDKGPFRVRLDASTNGGKDWETVNTYYLGGLVADRNEIQTTYLDVDPINSQRVRFRFRFGPENNNLGEQDFKINKLKLDFMPGGLSVD